MSYIIPIRPTAEERELIRAAARRAGLSISRFMVQASCKAAEQSHRTFASLEIDPEFRMPKEASQNPKAFIKKKILKKHAVHR